MLGRRDSGGRGIAGVTGRHRDDPTTLAWYSPMSLGLGARSPPQAQPALLAAIARAVARRRRPATPVHHLGQANLDELDRYPLADTVPSMVALVDALEEDLHVAVEDGTRRSSVPRAQTEQPPGAVLLAPETALDAREHHCDLAGVRQQQAAHRRSGRHLLDDRRLRPALIAGSRVAGSEPAHWTSLTAPRLLHRRLREHAEEGCSAPLPRRSAPAALLASAWPNPATRRVVVGCRPP